MTTTVNLKADPKISSEVSRWLCENAGDWTKDWTVNLHNGEWFFEFQDEKSATLFVLRWK